jgi:SAM-dependent methyltransferase
MLSRRAKAAFYAAAGPLMRLNGWLYRSWRAPRGGTVRVHLGPGKGNYLPGWINVDANMFTGACDVWADLRNPLPFPDGSVDAVYSHHVVEHLPDLRRHLRDVHRCLKPGGAYRFGGPNADAAIRKFLEKDVAWFPDFPDRRASVGGRLDNFLLCRNEHLSILSLSYLEELLTETGFRAIGPCLPARETRHPALFSECLAKEWESSLDCPHTLIVEAERP